MNDCVCMFLSYARAKNFSRYHCTALFLALYQYQYAARQPRKEIFFPLFILFSHFFAKKEREKKEMRIRKKQMELSSHHKCAFTFFSPPFILSLLADKNTYTYFGFFILFRGGAYNKSQRESVCICFVCVHITF